MMELADVTDSKSVGSDTVRVQVPLPAPYADMAELADALDSGSSGSNTVQVQVLLSAPNKSHGYGICRTWDFCFSAWGERFVLKGKNV